MEGKPSLATLKTPHRGLQARRRDPAEGGVVISSADGIVQVEGHGQGRLRRSSPLDNGAKGMVESVEPDHLGVMLFRRYREGGRGYSGDPQRQACGHPRGRCLPRPCHRPAGRDPSTAKAPLKRWATTPSKSRPPRHSGASERGYSAPHRHPVHRLHVPPSAAASASSSSVTDRPARPPSPSTPSSTRRTPACSASTWPSARRLLPSPA